MGAPRAAWLILATVALVLAALTLLRWAATLSADIPALYGEGAVVHAGRLVAEGADPYAMPAPGTFVAANYPPLSYALVALLAPLGIFTPYRVVSALAALSLAALIAWRARRSPLAAAALAASFLALFPLAIWGTAVKPDLLAVALTAFAVVCAGPSWRDASVSGALGALAVAAKPTAAVPLAVVLVYLLWRERASGVRTALALGSALAILAVAAALRFAPSGIITHVVDWNALPYSMAQTGLLALAAALTLAAFAALGALRGGGRMRAYVLGAGLVVLLGGREGATVNYLLDLAAASMLALAPAAAVPAVVPLTLAAQLAVSAAAVSLGVFAPDDLAPWRARVAVARELDPAKPQLSEESGVLIAAGIEPLVDDLFLWSRVVSRGALPDTITPLVGRGEIATVLSDVPLERLDEARAYERQRWPPALVRAVLERYARASGGDGVYRYVPR